ncbi:MAG: ACT domain-containing protein [Gammaproteobacteria bacterium]|nr:glycine cleavage system protein R [Pseudomonadales bacterium]MCP5347551.1 glycine cleavage system protein R [Pseudomonadales bacterium]
MTTYLVLTAIGDDRPGLVEQLAGVVARNAGNWLESSMSQLAGKFAGILRVSVPDENADQLIRDLESLSGSLKLVIERGSGELPQESSQPLKLSLIGNDRPGIIREISAALARQRVNVEELETECTIAPMSGETLFNAQVTLTVPADLDLDDLQRELEQIADDLIVDIQFQS